MSWLPEGYKVPSGGGQFMKLVSGANQFRILAEPVLGYEVWETTTEGRKPHRFHTFKEAVSSPFSDQIKHFWAFPVWNYSNKTCQVLQITQKTIMKAIEALQVDEDWGDPTTYDIVVSKSGDGMETEYVVQPKPAKPTPKEALEALKESKIDLSALFSGSYPMKETEAQNEAVVNSEEVASDVPF